MNSYTMSFDGSVLKRGFWLYIWRIKTPKRLLYYVGRNGDSSSIHASSPFVRIGQHLDFRTSAKGNSRAKRLAEQGVEPAECNFAMICIGPLFSEQNNREKHNECRDKTAALERDLAKNMKDRGLTVLGVHDSKKPARPELMAEILGKISHFIECGSRP